MDKKIGELKFGTSGLRDTVENMTDMECYINARGFISYLKAAGEFNDGDSIAVGGDRRPSTYRIKRAVAAALCDMGGLVDDQGQVPSPALAYYAIYNNMASIMVTGSHIPADRNGIKFTKRSGEVLKSDEPGILDNVKKEREIIYSISGEDSIFGKDGSFKKAALVRFNKLLKDEYYSGRCAEIYKNRYLKVFGKNFFPKQTKIFLYQHSAVGRDIVKDIFEGLGAEIFTPDIMVGGEPLRSEDFVPVDTESVSDKTLSIFKKVLEDNSIDIGITLDGDSDRPLIVYREYESGAPSGNVKYITGDILGLLSILGLEKMGIKINAVCVPISANDSIARVCKEKGIELTQTKIGSPFVIAAMNDSIARHSGEWNVFAWESNGGFLTGSDVRAGSGVLKALPTRDAVLPLLSVVHMVVKDGLKIQDVLRMLPSRFTHADRKKDFPLEVSKAIIAYLTPGSIGDSRESDSVKKRVESVFLPKDGFGYVSNIDYTDGVRILFDNGEIAHLRPSGNAPEFRVYAIAPSQARAKEIVMIGLEKIIPSLARIACNKEKESARIT